MPLCVRFLRTHHGVSLFDRVRGRRTPEVGTEAQCAMLSPLQRVRRPVTGSCTACRVDFVFLRRCRKPRVYRWRLHVCVRSCAVVGWSRSMVSRVSYTLSSTKLTIEFDKLRRRPRRDSHGTCRLSGDVQPLSWPMTTPPVNGVRHGSPRSLPCGC